MKNSLIYFLISLMIVSLIGSIALQGVWISNAYDEREREFASHVNDALNHVNDEIDKDEAEHFIERKFGGVDSLLHEMVVIHGGSPSDQVVVIDDESKNKSQIKIQYNAVDTLHQHLEHLENLHDSYSWTESLEVNLEGLDSLVEATVALEKSGDEIEHITNVVRHFTTEKIHGGKLESRISKDDLGRKISASLLKEGIADTFEFAVYDHHQMNIDHDFTTDGYIEGSNEKEFEKELFQNDRIAKGNYSLLLQVGNGSSYIWKRVRPMILLSILFTTLILLCFGYSLYFIFKQKKISQVKNDFINNMTHELKTPLASISLAASSIKHPEVIQNKEEVTHFVQIIESEERRINAHIERVLDIASLDNSDLQLQIEELDLIVLLKASISNVDLSLSDNNGHCTFDCSLNDAPLKADSFHLTNVFTNILDNSIKYKNDHLKIVVNLKKNDGQYIITISDNGIGMSAKSVGLAFDKFYREETGNIHTRKGFGLGLTYVKSIVEAHNGTVELTSEKNKGTTVTVTLPAK